LGQKTPDVLVQFTVIILYNMILMSQDQNKKYSYVFF